MNIKVHIVSFNENDNKLVAFCESDIGNTSPLAYFAHDIKGDTLDDKVKNIARYGIAFLEADLARRVAADNMKLKIDCSSAVGKVYEFNKDKLIEEESKDMFFGLSDITNS